MKDWIIYGLGKQKRSLARYLIENFGHRIRFAVDSDPSRWGKINDKIEVVSPDILSQYIDDDDISILISVFNYVDDIKNKLEMIGFPESRIHVVSQDSSIVESIEFELYMRNVNLENPIPRILNLELSGYCNCKCVYCPFHGKLNLKKDHKGFMNWETIDRIIELICKIGTIKTIDTTGPGEIFLNKEWSEMLSKILQKTNMDEVIIYTNGMLLNDENICKITKLNVPKIVVEISLDGKNSEENDK